MPPGTSMLTETTIRIRKVLPDGTVITIAGNGSGGFSGDAQLSNPRGLAVDASGNLYIADSNNQRIRMVAPNGTITTFAGNGSFSYSGDGGPATSAALAVPYGVATDS